MGKTYYTLTFRYRSRFNDVEFWDTFDKEYDDSDMLKQDYRKAIVNPDVNILSIRTNKHVVEPVDPLELLREET